LSCPPATWPTPTRAIRPALLNNGDGHAGYLDSASGAMLGVTVDADYTAGYGRLPPPGRRLLLYTDGLIEDRRRDITEGFSALARAMRPSRTQTAGNAPANAHRQRCSAQAPAPTTCASSPSAAKTSLHSGARAQQVQHLDRLGWLSGQPKVI